MQWELPQRQKVSKTAIQILFSKQNTILTTEKTHLQSLPKASTLCLVFCKLLEVGDKKDDCVFGKKS